MWSGLMDWRGQHSLLLIGELGTCITPGFELFDNKLTSMKLCLCSQTSGKVAVCSTTTIPNCRWPLSVVATTCRSWSHPLQDIAGSSFSCRDETCSWSEGWKTLCCSAHKDKNFSTSGEYHVLKSPILSSHPKVSSEYLKHSTHCACTGNNLHLHHVWKTS